MKIFLFLLLLSDCAVKKGNLFTHKSEPLKLSSKDVSFVFLDLRAAKEGNINLPIISWPGDSRFFLKRFSDEELESIVRSQFVLNNDSSDEAVIVVTTIMANQLFYATMASEVEAVGVRLSILKISRDKTCEGKSSDISGTVQSIDASVNYINSMLKDAIAIAFNEALRDCMIKVASDN